MEDLQNELEQLKRIMLETQQIMTNLCTSHKAMNSAQLAEYFGLSKTKVEQWCKCTDSPAYKKGGKTSEWMCLPDKFEKYLVKKTKENNYKG